MLALVELIGFILRVYTRTKGQDIEPCGASNQDGPL